MLRLDRGEQDNRKIRYRVTFLAITEREWEEVYARDPRDVAWVLQCQENGQTFPFSYFTLLWHPEDRTIVMMATGFRTMPDGLWSTVKRWIGLRAASIQRERARLGWRRLSKSFVQKKLRSGNRQDVEEALLEIQHFSSSIQAPWASDTLLKYAEDPDMVLRMQAVDGLGELARVHGYVDRGRTIPALDRALNDPVERIRQLAAQSLDEIKRFGL